MKPPKKSSHSKRDKKKSSKRKGKHPSRKGKRRSDKQTTSQSIQEVTVLVITRINDDGELIGEPVNWDHKRTPPHIVILESGRQTAASIGDRVLARMRKIKPRLYQALVIKILPAEQPKNVLGVFISTADGGIIEPISRKQKESFMVAKQDTADAEHGELVSAQTQPGIPSMGMTFAKIDERLGSLDTPRAASLIASSMHELPSIFSDAAVTESEDAQKPTLTKDREDLRDIPLVTIDGEDARDFDDAVFAERDNDKNNPGGWHIIVAIADVAHYVKEDSALDHDAFERGNSVYFPDRVIPMLPERLSNGLCSLVPDEDRYCLAVHIWIDAKGNITRYRFIRGLMRSKARLTYATVQSAHDAHAENTGNNHPLWDAIISPLYDAYKALAHERDKRGSLDLNLPEYQIHFDAKGEVSNIAPRVRLEAHRLIECYMIAANVAAADYLLKHKMPAIYRVHESPADDKLDELKQFLKMSGYSLHTGAGIKASHFNRVLHASTGQPDEYMIHTAILRSQMQAYYGHECLGHFGLSLSKYAHFTSPIRRYADLVVHRSLASTISQNPADRMSKIDQKILNNKLADIALHISETELRAMLAERDAKDRYKVSFMSRHIGDSFSGVIASLNEYGLFVTLNESGITGFIPVRNLPGDFYQYDKRHACFKGQRTKQTFTIGNVLMIRVQAANAITGSLIFETNDLPAPSEKPLKANRKPRGKAYMGKDGKTKKRYTKKDKDRRKRKKLKSKSGKHSKSG